jgi:hypothetical protein
MPPAGTFKERLALYKEMEQTGQIYTLVDHHQRRDEREPNMDNRDEL